MTARIPAALLLAGALAGCSSSATPATPPVPSASHAVPRARWIPAANSSYQIQYGGKLDLKVPAAIYDVDYQDTTAGQVAAIHARGRRAVCYVDVGTWERWRPDASQFPKSVLGKPDGGWPGERWLDIRQTSVLQPIMTRRFQLCKQKNFDGVDPDNLDGYVNKTGFHLTYAEQLAYDTWVANEAHAVGLTVAEKGDNNQVADLAKVYDFAVVEQCFAQRWCRQFERYTARNALVVDVEYHLTQNRFLKKTCPSDSRYRETAILKHLDLNAWILTCP
jgi:hypothetical protein